MLATETVENYLKAIYLLQREAAADEAKGGDQVLCAGINACKGQSACAGAGNACAGHNGCKGQGSVKTTAEDCRAKGGKVAEAKR